MEIATQNLNLRYFMDDDIDSVYEIAMQPGFHFFRLLSTERFHPELARNPTPEDVKNSSYELVKLCQDKTRHGPNDLPEEMKMAICLRDGGPVIGYMSLGALQDPQRDIGYFLHPKFQKQGYASEAAIAVIDSFYRNFHALPKDQRHIAATVHPENRPSQKLLQGLGFFREEAVLTTKVQGVQEPRLYYTLTPDQFKNGGFHAHH